MFGFTKKTEKIAEVTEKEVDGAEVWIVSWDSRYGHYHGDVRRSAKAFLLKTDAIAFTESLKNAQSILKYSEGIDIKIEKQ